MTASIITFDLTNWSAGSTSATAAIDTAWGNSYTASAYAVNNNDRFFGYKVGNTGILIRIHATS